MSELIFYYYILCYTLYLQQWHVRIKLWTYVYDVFLVVFSLTNDKPRHIVWSYL